MRKRRKTRRFCRYRVRVKWRINERNRSTKARTIFTPWSRRRVNFSIEFETSLTKVTTDGTIFFFLISFKCVTGHTENWTMEDHLFFLKMRKKCDNIPTLVAAVQKKFPDLSVETIVNHEAWYKQYTDLREKQKAAVKEWRQRKALEKKKNIDEMDKEIEDHCEDEDSLNQVPEEETIDNLKKTRPPARESRNSSASSSESQKKELIKKWRMEKENKRFMDEEQIKMQIKLRKEAEESKRKKRREKIQVALDEYKKKKCLENVLKEMEERSSKERRVYDTTLIKAFR